MTRKPEDAARSEKDKMLAGDLYHAGNAELAAARAKTALWLTRYNATGVEAPSPDDRRVLLAEHFAAVGRMVEIRPPFFCDYGFNIAVGSNVFLNFSCVILDIAPVVIGDGTQIGPAVQILAADHPRDPTARRAGLELGKPVTIGANVWIGGGALLLPGVTVGDEAIIGAGAVVTHDVAAGATVAGNPARPIG